MLLPVVRQAKQTDDFSKPKFHRRVYKNQKRRLIVKDVYKLLPGRLEIQFTQNYQMFSKSGRGRNFETFRTGPALVSKCRDKSAMTLKLNKSIIAGIPISDYLFLGCLS